MKPRIGFASTDWSKSMSDSFGQVPGGSNWIRLQQNIPDIGFSSVTGLLCFHENQGFGIIDWMGKTHYNLNIIVMQRMMFKDLVERVADKQKWGQVIINDVDDWYWGLHEDNHAYKLTHPDFNKEENVEHYRKIIQLSDAVTVSTPFLKEKMEKEFGCKNVHLIQNCVNINDFTHRYTRNKNPTVGWVGSTSHRSGDLEVLRGLLDTSKFKFRHSGHVEGAAWFADKVGLPREKVAKTPMHSPRMYAKHSFEFDIGLAPLNDIPFNYAKSWIKALEYAAAGVPFVASDIGEYRRLHDEYGVGRLASTPEEWSHHLEELRDHNARSKEAKRQKDIVRMQLNSSNMAKDWNLVLSKYL